MSRCKQQSMHHAHTVPTLLNWLQPNSVDFRFQFPQGPSIRERLLFKVRVRGGNDRACVCSRSGVHRIPNAPAGAALERACCADACKTKERSATRLALDRVTTKGPPALRTVSGWAAGRSPGRAAVQPGSGGASANGLHCVERG